MKHNIIEERLQSEAMARALREAEQALARVYRAATPQELIDSQLRVRECVVREMRRRSNR